MPRGKIRRSRGTERYLALGLATAGYTASFAAWTLIGALAPALRQVYRLSATEVGWLVAAPVLVGILARLAAGWLADRYGGHRVLVLVMALTVVPTALVPFAISYGWLLFWGGWMGLGGAAFSAGVPYLSGWFPAERRGFALGTFGAGTAGAALASGLAPLLAAAWGTSAVFLGFSGALLALTAVFWAAGKEAPGWTRSTEPLGPALAGLCRRPLTRVLSFFYVVTFGGFLALSVHLPTLLVEAYGMDGGRAGAHVAVFAIVGTLARPVGGHLADRFGGGRVLFMTFPAIAALAGALALEPGHLLVTSVLLGLGLSLGTGNGAVFELVAKRFTGGAGLAGGVVGAVGASGGIVLPIAQGLAQDLVGSYVVGFVLLAGLALVAWLLSLRVPSGQLPAGAE